MLAFLHVIHVEAGVRFPGYLSGSAELKFTDVPSGLFASLDAVPKLGWLQILTFIMFMEVLGILNSRRPDYEPGNFLGSSQWETDEGWESYQTKELNNGRLAMFGSIGMLTGSYITGKGPLEVMNGGDIVVF